MGENNESKLSGMCRKGIHNRETVKKCEIEIKARQDIVRDWPSFSPDYSESRETMIHQFANIRNQGRVTVVTDSPDVVLEKLLASECNLCIVGEQAFNEFLKLPKFASKFTRSETVSELLGTLGRLNSGQQTPIIRSDIFYPTEDKFIPERTVAFEDSEFNCWVFTMGVAKSIDVPTILIETETIDYAADMLLMKQQYKVIKAGTSDDQYLTEDIDLIIERIWNTNSGACFIGNKLFMELLLSHRFTKELNAHGNSVNPVKGLFGVINNTIIKSDAFFKSEHQFLPEFEITFENEAFIYIKN